MKATAADGAETARTLAIVPLPPDVVVEAAINDPFEPLRATSAEHAADESTGHPTGHR